MPDRISLVEQYNNRDVIAQMYRVIDIVEHGAIQSVSSEKVGETVTVSFTMHDGTVHDITFPANGIASITSRQDGSTMYVDVVLDNGTTETISWTVVPGVTLDTAQTITGAKTFSALGTFLMGLAVTGMSIIDGDLQIINGHNLSVAGDIDAAGALKGDSAEIRGPMSVSGQSEIAGMAIEPNGDATAISNDNGISSDSPLTLTGLVTATNIPTTDTGVRDTRPVNGTRLQNDLDAYPFMFKTTGNQTVAGVKNIIGQMSYGSMRTTTNGWMRVFTTNARAGGIARTWLFQLAYGIDATRQGLFVVTTSSSIGTSYPIWLVKGSNIPSDIIACTVFNGEINLWCSQTSGLSCIGFSTRAINESSNLIASTDTTVYDAPQSDDGVINYGTVIS